MPPGEWPASRARRSLRRCSPECLADRCPLPNRRSPARVTVAHRGRQEKVSVEDRSRRCDGGCNTDETGFVTASPTGCEAERIAQQSCIWNGEHCDELGGVTSPTGARSIECGSAFDCPLNILDCPAAATVWSTAYCAVKPEYQDEVGCGPEGRRPGHVIGGCELVCGGPEGDDSDCPFGMHCYADSIDEGEFFRSRVWRGMRRPG